MKLLLICMVLLVMVESILVLQLFRENRTLLALSAQLERARSDLAQSNEVARAKEAEVQSLKDQVEHLEAEVAHAGTALVSRTQAPTSEPLALEAEHAETLALGLTTNDVDLTSMRVTGNTNIGVLFVPLTGRALQGVRTFHDRHQPLVFGKLISRAEDYGVWGEYGTNCGVSLKFESKTRAEATGMEMRAHLPE